MGSDLASTAIFPFSSTNSAVVVSGYFCIFSSLISADAAEVLGGFDGGDDDIEPLKKVKKNSSVDTHKP